MTTLLGFLVEKGYGQEAIKDACSNELIYVNGRAVLDPSHCVLPNPCLLELPFDEYIIYPEPSVVYASFGLRSGWFDIPAKAYAMFVRMSLPDYVDRDLGGFVTQVTFSTNDTLYFSVV